MIRVIATKIKTTLKSEVSLGMEHNSLICSCVDGSGKKIADFRKEETTFNETFCRNVSLMLFMF